MTIYEIAAEAGVSASMVSRVINHKPGVAAQKREIIEALLEKYHYVPNELARGLVTSNSRQVGILTTDIRHEHQLSGAYYITEELSQFGYRGWIGNGGRGEKEHISSICDMAGRNVQGAVLMSSVYQSRAVENAIRQYMPDIPVLILNGTLPLDNVYSVRADIRGGIRESVKALIRKGRKKIVLMLDNPIPTTCQKDQGYRDAMEESGLECRIITKIPTTFEDGYSQMLAILKRWPDTDAVVCSLDIMACGAIRALWEKQIPVPQEIAVFGCDNTNISQIYTPKLSTLDTRLGECAVNIAHILIDCLEGRKAEKQIILQTSMIERETT